MRSANYLLPLGAAALGFALGTVTVSDRGQTGSTRAGNAHAETGSSTALRGYSSQDEAVTAALTALMARDDFRQLAQLGRLLDQLDSAQMRAFFDKLDRLPSPDREVFLPRLLAYWTKRDPQAAAAWMEPRLAAYARDRWFGNGFANFDTDLVKAWADNAPESAIEFARRAPRNGPRKDSPACRDFRLAG